MTPPDRSWLVVALGLVATSVVAAALGAVVTLWAVDRPAPPVATVKPVPVPAPAPAPVPAEVPSPPPAKSTAEANPVPASPAPTSPAPAEPAPPPAPAPEPAAAAAPADGDAMAATLPYAVQLGAFAELERAQHLAKAITEEGYPAEVEDHKSAGGHPMHYVRLAGGYGSMGGALSEAAALKRKLDIDAIAVRRHGAEAAP